MATVNATCTWVPAGGGEGPGTGPGLPIITGAATATAQVATYWNSAEQNLIALGYH